MLKIIFSYARFSLDNVSNAGIWNAKCLSAIALFGILLTISNTNRLLQQAGKSAALFAGGAAAATALKKRENLPEIYQWRRELQTAHEQQLSDLFTFEEQQRQVLGELYESAIAEATLLATVSTITATSKTESVQNQTRIAELEAALAAKATLAAEMLSELETEATRTFNQFNAKIVDQEALIKRLYSQVESLSATNAVLTERQTNEIFAHLGADPLKHHQLIKN
ncbi:MAG: hypothetical protein AAFY33_21185 [Cyanobacteria bacterium J06643_4]